MPGARFGAHDADQSSQALEPAVPREWNVVGVEDVET
jgi:hypothetical protein